MKQTLANTESIARSAFADIAAHFPRLEIIEETNAPVEISLKIPAQAGVKHRVWLALQNLDELSFGVESFQVEWFPCTDPEKVSRFIDAVTGYLSGRYRILEHRRGTHCFKAQLQRPGDNGWETIATWSQLRLPSFRKVSNNELVKS